MRRMCLMVLVGLCVATGARADMSRTLMWTAPGDDGMVGRASAYEVRFSSSSPISDTMAWRAQATLVSGIGVPGIAGSLDSCQVVFPGPGTYWVLLRTADEVPNWSFWSNWLQVTITDTEPPAPVQDLRLKVEVWPNPGAGPFFRQGQSGLPEGDSEIGG